MKLSLLTEGASDVVLLRPLRWLINDIDEELIYQLDRVDFSVLPYPPKTLRDKLMRSVQLYAPDVLLVHRDADGPDPNRRRAEIDAAANDARLGLSHIAVVPVTMTESWFLFDEQAIRKAAGNPEGTVPLELPAPHKLQRKEELHEQLIVASGKRGRQRRKLHPEEMFHILAERIDDFSPLGALESFQRLRGDLVRVLSADQKET